MKKDRKISVKCSSVKCRDSEGKEIRRSVEAAMSKGDENCHSEVIVAGQVSQKRRRTRESTTVKCRNSGELSKKSKSSSDVKLSKRHQSSMSSCRRKRKTELNAHQQLTN